MGELTKLPNIGPVIKQQLNDVGIQTAQQLKQAGSRVAWLKILSIDSSACIHRLYGLEGAILGIRKCDLPQNTKNQLKEFYNSIKKPE